MSAPLIGLVGAKRAGKDTFAEGLVALGWKRLAFADRLKSVALATDPTLDVRVSGRRIRLSEVVGSKPGWEGAKEDREVRRYLQNLGTAVRDFLGSTAWIDPVLREAAFYRAPGFGSLGEWHHGTPVVVTDVRFENEVEAILNAGGRIVKIERAGLAPDDSHVSERLAWDPALDYWRAVANVGSIEFLHEQALRVAASAWREAA